MSVSIFIGKAATLWQGQPPSAIDKKIARGVLYLTRVGFEGDCQADLKVHGGPEKAVHYYPIEHYLYWNKRYERNCATFDAGSFGENLSGKDLLENEVRIGDVFRLDAAVLQVSQGRTPCWKLNRHTGAKDIAAEFVLTGRTGWYLRVLEPGLVGQGSGMELVERAEHGWSVKEVTRARLSNRISSSLCREMSTIAGLSSNWVEAFRNKASSDRVDDFSSCDEGK